MKRLTCFLPALLLGCFAWTQPTIDTIDFLDPAGKLHGHRTLPYKKEARIRIININRNVFKEEDSFTETALHTTPPEAFSGINLPGAITFGPAFNRNNLDGYSFIPEKMMLPKPVDIALYLHYVTLYAEKIDSTVYLNNAFINLINNCSLPFTAIEQQTNELIGAFIHQPRAAGMSHAQYASVLQQQVTGWIQLARENFSKAKKLTDETYGNSVPDNLKVALKEAQKTLDDLKTFVKENKLQSLLDNYNKLSEPYFTYFTKPVKPTKDEVGITINITADKLDCLRPVPVQYSQTYRVAGGLKVDFSTGVFASFGNKNFLGRNLQYLPVGGDTVMISDNNDRRRAMLSVGALAHLYRRSASNLHLAFSPGVSTTVNLDAVNLHLGGSIMYGREYRAVLTVGTTLKQSTVLGRDYRYNTLYDKKKLPEEVPAANKFPLLGYFISLTYNLSPLEKE